MQGTEGLTISLAQGRLPTKKAFLAVKLGLQQGGNRHMPRDWRKVALNVRCAPVKDCLVAHVARHARFDRQEYDIGEPKAAAGVISRSCAMVVGPRRRGKNVARGMLTSPNTLH